VSRVRDGVEVLMGEGSRPGPFKFAMEHRDPQVERVIRAAVASVA
jgi:hypothetical protein